MAVVFTKYAPVLFFNPNSWPYKAFKMKYLLWPAYAFRVVSPVPKIKKINLFQRYILSLLQTNLFQIKDIATCLGLEAELVQTVCQQLEQMKLIDEQGFCTPVARELLKDGHFQEHEMQSGYIFQNPFDGKFWPRFVNQLEFCDTEYDDKQRAIILIGSENNPWRERPFRIVAEKIEACRIPQAEEVLGICQAYWREHHQFHSSHPYEQISLSLYQYEQTSLVSEIPLPCLLATYAYTTKFASDNTVQVCDPFGLGRSSYLESELKKYEEYDPNLKIFLKDLTEENDKVVHENNEKPASSEFQNKNEVFQYLEKTFGKNITLHEDLCWKLYSLESLKIDLQKQSNPSLLQNIYKDSIHKCMGVWRELLTLVQDRFFVKDCWAGQGLINYDNEHNATMLDKIASKIGFCLLENERLPDRLRYCKLSILQQANYFHSIDSLACCLIVVLLQAHRLIAHPFYNLANNFPEFLLNLAKLMEQEKQNGSTEVNKTAISFVMEQIEMIHKTLPIFLQFPS